MASSASIQGGNEVEFDALFSNADTKEPVDPTHVAFSWSVNEGTPTVYTYGSGIQIVRLDVGSYRVRVGTIDMAPAGSIVDLTGQWDTLGVVDVSEAITVRVSAPKIPSPFG